MANLIAEDSSWRPYLKYGERKFFRKKTPIYCEKESNAKGFYYLEKGLIKISATNHNGDECIIDIVSDGNPFGEQTADGELYFSTASVVEDSIVYFFCFKYIESMMEKDDGLRRLIYHNLTEKIKLLSNNIISHSLPSEKILARTILHLHKKLVTDYIPFTQRDLSCYTNLNRITIYNIFKKWGDDVVSLCNQNITINNISLLKSIAEI